MTKGSRLRLWVVKGSKGLDNKGVSPVTPPAVLIDAVTLHPWGMQFSTAADMSTLLPLTSFSLRQATRAFVLAGFCAQPDDVARNAQAKLKTMVCDFSVLPTS